MTYIAFTTWAEVLAHVGEGKQPIFYHAPLDRSPRLVQARVKGENVRVYPLSKDTDSFTADSSHLDRFKRIGA